MFLIFHTHLPDLQHRVDVVQVHCELLVLHVVDHPGAADVVERFLMHRDRTDEVQLSMMLVCFYQRKADPLEEGVEDSAVQLGMGGVT